MRTIIMLLVILVTSLALAGDQKANTDADLNKYKVDIMNAVREEASGTAYISASGARIREKFHVPTSMDKNLVTTINLRISKSGNVTRVGFEKKSGTRQSHTVV